MQSLEVISVNLWNTVVSILNLLVLYLIFKKFLFKPVNNMIEKRNNEIEAKYKAAEDAKLAAEKDKLFWDEKIGGAKKEAEELIDSAKDIAMKQSDSIISKAKERAYGIIRQAETQAELEMKKAEDGVKKEIIDVSAALTEKLLGREINEKDHKNLIDSFIEKIGDGDE